MSRPGIVRVRRALDDQEGIRIVDDTERNGGAKPLGLRRRRRWMGSQVRRESVDRLQWEWPPHPPPPQHPPAGGPSPLKSLCLPPPARAGTERSFSTLALPHPGQATAVPLRTRSSKRLSHLAH